MRNSRYGKMLEHKTETPKTDIEHTFNFNHKWKNDIVIFSIRKLFYLFPKIKYKNQ